MDKDALHLVQQEIINYTVILARSVETISLSNGRGCPQDWRGLILLDCFASARSDSSLDVKLLRQMCSHSEGNARKNPVYNVLFIYFK